MWETQNLNLPLGLNKQAWLVVMTGGWFVTLGLPPTNGILTWLTWGIMN